MRDYKKEYQQRKTYLKAYRKRKQADNTSRKRASRAMKCPKGQEADHKDDNPKNNNRSNLRCISRKENRQKGARKTHRVLKSK